MENESETIETEISGVDSNGNKSLMKNKFSNSDLMHIPFNERRGS